METPHVPDSSALPFRARLTTRWSDEDNQGVLNNAVFLTLFEETRLRYFRGLGQLSNNQFSFLLGQTNVVFLAPGVGGREVIVELGTTHVGTTSLTQAYRVRDAESGQVWCEAETRLVGWDNEKRAKQAWSSAFRAAIEASMSVR